MPLMRREQADWQPTPQQFVLPEPEQVVEPT